MARRWLKAFGVAAAGTLLLPAAAGLLYGATRPQPCDRPQQTASIGANQASSAQGPSLDRLTIVVAGDTGFNPSDAKVDEKGLHKGRDVTSFTDALSGIARDVDGDLAFVNLETVVTDRNDLKPEGRGRRVSHFRSHPAALKALIDTGFNLFSLANEHAFDYGAAGIEETLYHLAVANAASAIFYAGIGATLDEAMRPACVDLGGTRVGFSAIGILPPDKPQARAGAKAPGQASYRDKADFEAVVDKLAALPAEYRILSIHYGDEGELAPDDRQLQDWRGLAAEQKGIDLVLGHHPHVAQGVEIDGKSLIFYGLGNFLHPGAPDMTRSGICRDYGLMAKVHLARAGGAWRVEAIEAIPLANTQAHPERLAPEESTKRIYALNHLAAALDDGKGAKGVRFTPQADGSGLYCADGAGALGGKIGTLCQAWQPAQEPEKALADKIADACEDKPNKPAVVKRRLPRRSAPATPNPFGIPF
jgi:poly-gamma-glutamate synthesis protein (capsule biosynthesis protein)